MADFENMEVDDLPPGFILIRKEDGTFALLKMEQDDQEINEEIIEQAEMEGEEDEHIREEDDVEYVDDDHIVEDGFRGFTGAQTFEELDIDVIPDIIEENLSPYSVGQAADDAQVEFVEAGSERKARKPYTSTTWKGIQIPSDLSPEEVSRFKARHILQRLYNQVKRNKQKVDIFSKKNDELRKLISAQREQMTKMGFAHKDIARLHMSKRKQRPETRFFSSKADTSLMSEPKRLAYEKQRLDEEYAFYRRSLKAILSSHRRYKKIFVENHEKIQNGTPAVSENVMLLSQNEPLMKLTSDEESDSVEGRSVVDDPDCKPLKPFKCFHCSFSAESKKELIPHIRVHLARKKKYQCPVCPHSSYKITPFMEHMKLHPGAKAFKCDSCEYRTAHPSALKNHKTVHNEARPYKCPVCGYTCRRSDHLRSHMRCHSEQRLYPCQLCDFASKYASGRANHFRRVHRQAYEKRRLARLEGKPIDDGDEEFDLSESDDPGETTEIEVDEHGKIASIRTITRKPKNDQRRTSLRKKVEKKYVDFTDGEEFDDGLVMSEAVEDEEGNIVVNEVYLKESEDESIGERAVEGDERDGCGNNEDGEIYEDEDAMGEEEEDYDREDTHSEEDCDFSDKAEDLVKFSSSRSNRPKSDLLSSYVIYQCAFCDFSCEMKNNLLDHLRTHMETWTFCCKICSFKAETPSDLQTHTDEHKDRGEFTCHYCDHVASSKANLKKHVLNRHPPGKPLACVHCNFVCSKRLVMKNHMCSHRSKKTWQCRMCDYKSSFPSSLKRHIRKHTGERPYHCPHCEFHAAQYSHLTRHLRRFHPDEPALLERRPASPFLPIFPK